MENKNNFFARNAAILVPTAVMMAICLVVAAALSGTNLLTKDRIKQLEEKEQNASMSEVLKADEYEQKDDTTYIAKSNGDTVGYIFVIAEKGYGGEVKVMAGIKADGEISAVKVLDATSETPGLGQNTGKEDFYNQYAGLSSKSEIEVKKNGASKEENSVNAVTGATISSKAVTKAVNTAGKLFEEISKEGGKQDE